MAKTLQKRITSCDFTKFPKQIPAYPHSFRFRSLYALDIQNLSNRCSNKYDPSISRNFVYHFWRVFAFWPNWPQFRSFLA